MSVQVLYRSSAFGPGSDLWIVPDVVASPLARKVDWYLNFQLARAKHHKNQDLGTELRTILNQNGWETTATESGQNSALMVAAKNYFPTQMVVLVPGSTDRDAWVREVQTIWRNLGGPTLRVFLPQNLEHQEFQKLWPSQKEFDAITVVPS